MRERPRLSDLLRSDDPSAILNIAEDHTDRTRVADHDLPPIVFDDECHDLQCFTPADYAWFAAIILIGVAICGLFKLVQP